MGIGKFQKAEAGGLLLMQIWHMWQMLCRRLCELDLQKLVCFLVTITALLMPWSRSWAQTGDEWDWAYEPHEVELGFDFEFYGQSFNKVYLTENGMIQFSNPQAIKTPTCLPASQNNALYVFWDDFRTDYENGGYFSPLMYEVQGEAPNRRFIAEWAYGRFVGSTEVTGIIHAILYEGSNQIQLQYRDLSGDRSQASQATIGIQGPAGQYEQIGCAQLGAIRDGQAILFTPDVQGASYAVNLQAEYEDILYINPDPIRLYYTSNFYINKSEDMLFGWDLYPQANAFNLIVWDADDNVLLNKVLHASSDEESVGENQFYCGGYFCSYHLPAGLGLVHNQSYHAQLQGSFNGGISWHAFSGMTTAATADLVAPSVELKSLEIVDATYIKIIYSATDDGAGMQHVAMQVATDADFTDIVYEYQGFASDEGDDLSLWMSYAYRQPVAYIRIAGVDYAGNVSAYTTPIRLETGAAVINYPTDDLIVSHQAMTVTGTANPQDALVLYVNGAIRGGTFTANAQGEFSTTFNHNAEGEYRVYVRSTHQDSTITYSAQKVYRYQQTTPEIALVKPTEGQTITDGILEIEAQASDMAGVSYVGFYLDEESIGSASEEPYAITYNRSSVANGPHALSAVVMNVNGNINRDARSIEFMVPPQILEPFYSEVIRPEVSVQGTARLPAAAQVQLYLNDEAVGTPIVTQSNGTFSTMLVLPEEGEYTLSADATYEFGTTPKSTPRAFGLHFTTPVVHWIQPATNATLTEATLLEVRVSDQVDVTQIELFVDNQLLTTWAQQSETDYYTYLWDIAGLDNGRHELKVRATNEYGKVAELTRSVVVQAFVPQITAPVNGASTNQAQITVEGLAYQGIAVQVYANGIAQGERVVANAQGHFSVPVVLPAEGSYSITADAQTPNGTSDLSVPVEVRFALPVPRAAFVTPANNAVLSASTMIEVSAADVLGIDRVEFYADEHLLGTVTQAPYAYAWPVELDDNGTHTLMARVYNTSGKQVSVVRQVQVDVPEPVPPVPPTPYTGVVQSVTPAVSYGDVPVEIAGHAVNRASGLPTAHTPLKLVLTVKGFERQINVVTDAQGSFTYQFVPQESDAGVYGVAALHPNKSGVNSQGSFDIRRVRFAYSGYSLTAARNYASQVNVRATVSSDTSGLRWVIRAEDQPSGSLPNGIRIDTGSGIDIAAGGSADVGFTFTADDSAGESGTVILAALADDSGTRVRARLQLNYRLIAAASGLYPEQTYIETGVQQDSSVTEQLVIGNRGLVSATNVRVALVDEQGNPAPQWLFVAGSTTLGDVAVGEYATVEIVAQPDATITDGMYRFNLLIRSDNDAGGTVPVAVAVMQSGQGGMRFQVEDIYTGTLGEGGQPVAGVGEVRIKLQNEVVLSEQYTLVTDDTGMALIEDLPPGVYTYRASVANHMDVSGRLRIRPGVTGSQYIFMDYQLVSIEFSVTETTIQDIYDVILEATFNTQVPAPVVLLEPLSINIAGMQAGEVRTGELTLTNYGLIEAQEVNFQPAQSDAQFRYEFFADIPDTLPPKTRIVIPYRVTALGGSVQGRSAAVQTQGTTALGFQSFAAASTAEATSAADCTSHTYPFYVDYQYECINGQWVKSGNGGYFIYLQGQSCKPTSVNWNTSGSGGGGGGWINGGWSGATATPMAPACTPNAQQGVCTPGGGSLPPGLGGSVSSMGGADSLGTPR